MGSVGGDRPAVTWFEHPLAEPGAVKPTVGQLTRHGNVPK
jgi:hypothetical protein